MGRYRTFLLDLGHVTVPAHAVAVDALRNFSVEQVLLGAAPRSTDARLGIDYDVLLLNQASLQPGTSAGEFLDRYHCRGVAGGI